MVGHGFSSFCVSGQYFATKGCLQRGESLISGSGGRKGGQEPLPFGGGGLARGDGPEGRVGPPGGDERGGERAGRLIGLPAGPERAARPSPSRGRGRSPAAPG